MGRVGSLAAAAVLVRGVPAVAMVEEGLAAGVKGVGVAVMMPGVGVEVKPRLLQAQEVGPMHGRELVPEPVWNNKDTVSLQYWA
jgi:hypothetical protein